MFVAALFVIGETKQMDNKRWHIHTMEYRLVIKRNEVLMHATTSLKNIMLYERSQSQTTTHYVTSLHKISKIGKSMETKSILLIA